MRVYLVAAYRFRQLMRMYLAESGCIWGAYFEGAYFEGAYLLQSFFYADEFTERIILPNCGDFMLDSGAYTFMQNTHKGSVDWDSYIERYADFVRRNRIQKYFELDIDSVVGYDTVKRYRDRLESLVGWQSIPVWHTGRGQRDFEDCAKRYPYVAIGGLVGTGKSEYARKYWKYFPWFIRTAHDNGAKIHALGFTSMDGIRKYHFDSVDSTGWTAGNRFGHLFQFDGQTIKTIRVPPGHRLASSKATAINNFQEWVKFQRWAETHL